ncbi:MAG: class I SAM-dependent methyltransferase [Planctomycetota bacterium]
MLCSPTERAPILPKNEQAAKVWDSGGEHYERISRQISDAIDHCVDRLSPLRDEYVLDIATGTGWTARRIAEFGASVTGVDISATALNTARLLNGNGQIEFRIGDAEALPFLTGKFDAVTSTFGVMFCSDPESAASEMARVCKLGGRLALAVWDNCGGVHDMFQIISKFKPKMPAPAKSPFDWAQDDRLEELLSRWFDLRVERAVSFYREESPELAWKVFSEAYGPLKTLAQTLDAKKLTSLRNEFIDFHRQFETPLGILVPRDYVIVTGQRNDVMDTHWHRGCDQ